MREVKTNKKHNLICRAAASVLVLAVGIFLLTGCGSAQAAQDTETKFLTAMYSSDTMPEGETFAPGVDGWKEGWLVDQFPDATESVRKWLYLDGMTGYGLFPAYMGEFAAQYNATYRIAPEKVELTLDQQGGADSYRVVLNVTDSPNYTRVVAKGQIQLDDEGKVSFVSIDGFFDEEDNKLMNTLFSLNSDKAEPK